VKRPFYMKKLIALTTFYAGGSFLLFLLTLLGCSKKDYSILFKDIRTAIVIPGNNGIDSVIVENDTCAYPEFFIEGHFDVTQIASGTPMLPVNAAYAFQPAEPSYTPIEKISSIKITTLNSYNNHYPAGSDITGACSFIYSGYSEAKDSTAASLIRNLNQMYSGVPPMMRIYLREAPVSLSAQKFAVTLTTEVDVLIRDTTIVFYLKP
jgi:hypothetical protein